MRKLLFIDRDGTLLKEPPDEQIDSFAKMEFLPYCLQSLAAIAQKTDYELVLVSNQDELGSSTFPEESFWSVQNLMLRIMANEGIKFTGTHIDRSSAQNPSPNRKPNTGLLHSYVENGFLQEQSYVIGDRWSDLALAKNLGCPGIFISKEETEKAVLTTTDWREIANFLIHKPRQAEITRQTYETHINLKLKLDGQGKTDINTGLGFFDHMLEQITRHGEISLYVDCRGDLHVDEHHTVEDVALALGRAFRQALGSKKGIERYGFSVPMDDAKANVAIDFGGRPYFVWQAPFQREKVGDVPCELFEHFFKSFSDEARCNLHIKAHGQNEHHKIEAIFKAFAKALKMAITQNSNFRIPSTKGIL